MFKEGGFGDGEGTGVVLVVLVVGGGLVVEGGGFFAREAGFLGTIGVILLA